MTSGLRFHDIAPFLGHHPLPEFLCYRKSFLSPLAGSAAGIFHRRMRSQKLDLVLRLWKTLDSLILASQCFPGTLVRIAVSRSSTKSGYYLHALKEISLKHATILSTYMDHDQMPRTFLRLKWICALCHSGAACFNLFKALFCHSTFPTGICRCYKRKGKTKGKNPSSKLATKL
jgi:hypothetical protein